ncbi:unnamed protein product [[Candida] boidinii]|nr:unnamed protein product [[Candida] boidinii]
MLSDDELDRNAEKLRKLKSKGAEKYNNKRSRDEYEDEDDLENELVDMADDGADEEDEDTSSSNRKKKRVIIDEDEDDY